MTLINQTPFGENIKQTIPSHWWMPLVRGILLVIFGVIMLAWTHSTFLSLTWFLGIYWIVKGIFSIREGIRGYTEKSRTWLIAGGILGILAGLFFVGNPVVSGLFSGTFIACPIGFVIETVK